MGNIQLFNGRCLDYTFPLDAYIISDPPYNQDYHYDGYNDKLTDIEYRYIMMKVFSNRKSVIIHYPEETINILATIGLGFCKQTVSWVYNSNTRKQHRLITWWNCAPDFSRITQPYKNPNDKRIKALMEKGRTGSALYDWWEIQQVKNVSKVGNPHPCPVPLEIMKRIILLTTNEGDMVVDPFMGSGTTGLACKETNRNFIGVELVKQYYDYACNLLL